MPWSHVTGHLSDVVWIFSAFGYYCANLCNYSSFRYDFMIELIELNFLKWHWKHFHERLTPELPSASEQRISNSLHGASYLASLPSSVLHQPPQNLDDANRKRWGSVSIFSPYDFVFIAHSPGAPEKKKHSIFCICWERCVLSAFFPNCLDKLITQHIIYFFIPVWKSWVWRFKEAPLEVALETVVWNIYIYEGWK